MNAILFLLNEHQKFRQIFKEISEKPMETKNTEKFITLCQDLMRHEKMEQTVWYPILLHKENLADIIKHLISEEQNAEKTMKEFAELKSKEAWEEKFLNFKNDVEHHANEEETKLFPAVEKVLNEEELEKIGSTMQEFKKKFNESV